MIDKLHDGGKNIISRMLPPSEDYEQDSAVLTKSKIFFFFVWMSSFSGTAVKITFKV